MAVIGGGPIGAEMAQTFARFGTQVTVFIKDDHFLPREDREAAAVVEQAFRRDGVQFICGANLQQVTRAETGKTLHYQQGDQPGQLEVDAILVSIGRVPNGGGLNLEAANVAYTERGVTVDDGLRTSNPRIYAAVIHPYPTQTEAIKKIADGYNRTRLTPTVKRLFTAWLSWARR